jgi:hypothetical protein
MARARNIKPGFFRNEVLAELPALSRLLFIGLWTLADREGRLEDRPKRIKADLFPYEEQVDVESMLTELSAKGFVIRYVVDGHRFVQIANFSKHQDPHYKEKASEIPPVADGSEWQESEVKSTLDQGHVNVEPSSDQPQANDPGSAPSDSGFLIPDSGFLIPPSDTAYRSAGPTSARQDSRKQTVPCPYRDIVARYHEHLPMLPKVRAFDGPVWDKRTGLMRKLWAWVLSSKREDGTKRAETAQDALNWIGTYFATAAQNSFVVGLSRPFAGHEGWKADIDYLLSPNGIRQVLEKTQVAA